MHNFSTLPSVNIKRSKFKRFSQHKTSINLGEITPIYLDEVLPGDTRRIDIGALIRMSTPAVPVLDNIYMDIYAFFVPNRLVWDNWKLFIGENTSGAGIYSGTPKTVPQAPINGLAVGSLGDHYGLPVGVTGFNTGASVLPLRGYRLIYNRWFRDQNIIAPLTVSKADTAGQYDQWISGTSAVLQKAAKKSDYFTRSLPYAQKGSPVSIPLGTTAPVKISTFTGPSGVVQLGSLGGVISNSSATQMQVTDFYATSPGQYASAPATGNVAFVADLSQATAATINQLRFAFQYQKLLEKDALYGSRYWELLKAHFGVIAPDASLQDPQYLGHMKINISIDQVLNTTGVNQQTPSSNELGATGAVSVTGKAGNLFTFSATEHGYIHILAVARHDQTYSQGLERHWSRLNRTDFYWPVFANLGCQPVYEKELYCTGNSANDDLIFGYQESWSEYRYKNSLATGYLRPGITSSLGVWTLASNFASAPTLGQTFIEQDRSSIARVLQTGNGGPDFICDFAFKDIAVRPMPLYSVPGLIDHH